MTVQAHHALEPEESMEYAVLPGLNHFLIVLDDPETTRFRCFLTSRLHDLPDPPPGIITGSRFRPEDHDGPFCFPGNEPVPVPQAEYIGLSAEPSLRNIIYQSVCSSNIKSCPLWVIVPVLPLFPEDRVKHF